MSDPQLTVDEVVDRILQAVDSDGDGKHFVTCHIYSAMKAHFWSDSRQRENCVVLAENINPALTFLFHRSY